MTPSLQHYSSAAEVIDAVGGTNAFARWLGVDRRLASVWRLRGFPAKRYKAITGRLRKEHRIVVADEAFNLEETQAA